MKRLIAIKRSAAVIQYSQIMSCHVMPCHASSGLSTFTIWEPECWQCGGKQDDKGESLESGGVGNLDKRFSYSQGCSDNLQ